MLGLAIHRAIIAPVMAETKKPAIHTASIPRPMADDCVQCAELLGLSVSKFVTMSTQAILDMIATSPDEREVPLIVRLSDAARSHQPLRQVEEEEAKRIRKKS